jgi:hypothetical protein
VISRVDGQAYVLRRFEGVRTTQKIVNDAAEIWNSIEQHPNLVHPKSSFVYQGCVFWETEYHACAETLTERYMKCIISIILHYILRSMHVFACVTVSVSTTNCFSYAYFL